MKSRRIIGTHAHIFPEKIAEKASAHVGEYYHYTMHGKGTIEDLLQSASQAGVEKLLVFSTATKAEQVENVNDFTAANINENIAGFGSIHPDYRDFEKEIDRIISLGLKGIKLHPDFQAFDIDDPKMYPIYEAAERQLIFLFHLGDENSDHSAPRRLAKVLDDFPHLTAIGAHMGGYLRWEEAEQYLLGRDLYLDTSSTQIELSDKEMIRLIHKHDTDRILFATDYPLTRHDVALDAFLALGLTPSENEKILFENAQKLLFSDKS